MKKLKLILSIWLTIAMLFSLLPINVFADNNNMTSFTASKFKDIDETDWFYNAVNYVRNNKIMSGTSDDMFSPNLVTTRGMIVTILYRLEGMPKVSGAYFDDVFPEQYYSDAVCWASQNGIVSGYGNNLFGPNDPITREQMASIMYRYSYYKNYDTAIDGDITKFNDGILVETYAVDAMNWAVGKKLISGIGDNKLDPKGSAIRSQIAIILMQFCETIVSENDKGQEEQQEQEITDTFIVSFDYNYDDKDIYKTIIVEAGHKVDKPGNPSRNGYSFDGWYSASSGKEKFNFDTVITEDIILYAKWIKNSSSGSSSSGGGSSSGGNSSTPSPEPEPEPEINDDTLLNPDVNETGDYNRQEWIKMLVDKVGLTSDSTQIDSSFSDVTNNVYVFAIETALKNGVISQTEDNKFYPDYVTTTAFAAVTTVKALGYAYESIEDCYQIASDVGIMNYDNISTDNNLTQAQANNILSSVDEIIGSTEIDTSAEPIIDISDNTVILSEADLDYTYSNISNEIQNNDAKIIIETDEDLNLQEGKCVLLPGNEEFPGGLAQKIIDIENGENGEMILTTITPTLDEFMGDDGGRIAVEGSVTTDSNDFIIIDEFDEKSPATYNRNVMAMTSSGLTPFSIELSENTNSISVAIECSEDDTFFENSKLELEISYPSVDFNIDLEKFAGVPIGVNDLYIAINNEMNITGGLNIQDDIEPLELGRIPVPLGAGFSIDIVLWLNISANGELSLTYTLETTNGIQYTNGRLRSINLSDSDLEFKPLECTFEVGPELSAMLTLGGVFDLADITASTGLGMKGSLTQQDFDKFCVDGKYYVYLNISALNPDRSIIGEILDITPKWNIWDDEESIFDGNLHFEADGETFEKVPVCSYGDGDIEGILMDAQTDYIITNFEIYCTRVDDNTSVDFIKNIVDGKFIIRNLPSGTYLMRIVANGYNEIEKQVNVLANRTVDIGVLRLVSTSAEQGSGSGNIVDAITGEPISGALIELYQGGNILEDAIYTTTTNSLGEFILEGIAGNYTAIISKSGYTESTDNFIMTYPITLNQNFTLIPIGVEETPEGTISEIGDLRIVLTWGEYPSDLDSHLCGPMENGTDRFHVYYSDKKYYEDDVVHSFLDLDDVTSYGPETTTVYNIKDNGKYSFYVHDYTNRNSTSSNALAKSGANVKVYVKEAIDGEYTDNGEQLYRAKMIAALYVPNLEGTLWHVFDYNAATGELIRSDDMSYTSSPVNVGMMNLDLSLEDDMDIEIIKNSIIEKE